MNHSSVRRLASTSFVLLVLSLAGYAKDSPDRTRFSHDIHIQDGEKAGDVTCINCSIYLRGQVTGDVTTIHGNIVVAQGAEVSGDVTAVWGNIRADDGSDIAGDATSVAGAVHRSAQANVAGDVTSLEGTLWLLAVLLPPIVVIGLIVAFIIWLVQRSRHQVPVPA